MKSRSAFWYPGWGSLWCAGHLEPMAAREHALVIKSPGSRVGSTSWSHWQIFFFVASAFRPVWPGRCIWSLVCVPRPTRTLDQGGVEPRLAVSLRPEGHRQYHYSTDAPLIPLAEYSLPRGSMWYSWVCAVLPMLVAHIVSVSFLSAYARLGP